MAHTAGSAALLLAAHSDWSPAQVKSALVNNADRPVKNPSSGAPLASPMSRGGGRINVGSAMNTPATLSPASVCVGVQRSNGGLNGNLHGGLSDVDAFPAELVAQMTGTNPPR